ncbi:MAG: xanthine dehydrogenase family protein molybdopterin-binding subunit [Alphaproteobacteria bacterium]|nr:xanthine dehydrogenase family protein molybdopterin-binding subunit [Alphaproteobacteria bacterium]
MTDDVILATVPLKFGSGPARNRQEDHRLLSGGGRYTEDVHWEGQAHGYVFRAPYGHAKVLELDVSAAREAESVLAVYTYDDLKAAGYGPFPFGLPVKNADGSDPFVPDRHALASDKIRHVGEPLAFVVAETRVAAQDAAEQIYLDVEILEAVTDPTKALDTGAPQLFDGHANQCIEWQNNDGSEVSAALEAAAHVATVEVDINRLVVATMEPRGAIAKYDAANEHFTLHLGGQGNWGTRQTLATAVLKIEPEKLRVVCDDIGGSFGMKAQMHAEPVLVLHAARDLGRAVHWMEDRSGSFVSDMQGRGYYVKGELGLDEAGNFVALRLDGFSDLGGWCTALAPMMHGINIMKNAPSLYKTPLMHVHTRAVFTNKVPMAPYRGAGRPEGNYVMERLVEAAAEITGRDALELRRLNFIQPDAIPFKAASGLVYDSGDFPALMEKALSKSNWQGFDARREQSIKNGYLRGRGIASFLEVTGPPGAETGGIQFSDDGQITIVTGTSDQGQGHLTAFAEILHQLLGVPHEAVLLNQGDSDQLLGSGGTGGSKSLMATGTALDAAATVVIEKGRKWAGHILEAAVEDIEFSSGNFQVVGTDKSVPLIDLAQQVMAIENIPDDMPDSLDTKLTADSPPSAFPNGCHVCEVEIDPATGQVRVDRYTAVDDFGTVINQAIVEGQVHGGIVQGLGQVLMEDAYYDADGQLLAGSFMDYAMPRAQDMPWFDVSEHPVPATTNILGVKGVGEAGTSGSIPSAMIAILDALKPLGVTDISMPATPERVWQAIQDAKSV